MKNATPSFHPERGGVGFYIILAIAMLGGLSFMIAKGNRFGTKALGTDQARMAAQEIINYGNTLASTVQKMRLRGIPENGLSFENDVFVTNDGTPLTPPGQNPTCTEDTCKVFHPSGGKVNPLYTPEGSAKNTENPGAPAAAREGAWSPHVHSVDGIGTAQKDLTMLSGYITPEVCIAINDALDVTNPGGLPPTFNYGAGGEGYTGTFGAAAGTFSNGAVTNQASYCYGIAARPGVYNYMVVLIAR